MGAGRLLAADFASSFMWVWSGALIKALVFRVMGLGHGPAGEAAKAILSVVNMFAFAFMGRATGGGAYNPLTVLSSAIAGGFPQFLFAIGARIPAQVLGSITGVRLLIDTLPGVGLGPQLNIDIHRGALTEGLLTFTICIISLGLSRKSPGSFFMKTWIASISKLALHVLGSDLTGGCMNPASVFGWAYARGDHVTREHILVYWLAPIEATLLAAWTFKLLVKPLKQQEKEKLKKSD